MRLGAADAVVRGRRARSFRPSSPSLRTNACPARRTRERPVGAGQPQLTMRRARARDNSVGRPCDSPPDEAGR